MDTPGAQIYKLMTFVAQRESSGYEQILFSQSWWWALSIYLVHGRVRIKATAKWLIYYYQLYLHIDFKILVHSYQAIHNSGTK